MKPPALTIDHNTEPNDAYNIVHLIYLFYGIGVLLPWNILLSCMDFLIEKVSRTTKFNLIFRCQTINQQAHTHLLRTYYCL